jgi:hypothetical protein
VEKRVPRNRPAPPGIPELTDLECESAPPIAKSDTLQCLFSAAGSLWRLSGIARKLRSTIDLKLIFVFGVCIVGGFDACTSVAFRTEANTFTSAYGDVLNGQMLLNLARLDNGHPAYFIAVGVLNSHWNMGATATGGVSPSDTDSTTRSLTQQATPAGGILRPAIKMLQRVATSVVGGTASTSFQSTATPDWQLIPLNNDQLTQLVLSPTRTSVFFTLYDQGVPVDLLMRVLVEEIQTTTTSRTTVQRNDPTGGPQASYVDFLRLCQVARDLQRNGFLRIESTKGKFSPSGDPIDEPPDPWVVLQTQQGGAVWKQQAQKWQLGKEQSGGLAFTISDTPPYNNAIAKVMEDGNVPDRDFVRKVVVALATSSVLGNATQTTGNSLLAAPRPDLNDPDDPRKVLVILRSYSRVLEAVAREQNNFPKDARLIPVAQDEPVIRTKWTDPVQKPGNSISSVRYAGQRYIVADPENPVEGRSKTWNRDVFRLLIALNSQVAVDISKYQRQVLELRQ